MAQIHLPISTAYAQREASATYFMDNLSQDQNILPRFVFPDECVLHMSGIAKILNSHILSTENSRDFQQHKIHSDRRTTWFAMHVNGVLDTYYFDKQTVRGADYNHLLHIYIRAQASNFPSNDLFQQPGSPP